jgi:chromosomal replication initiation ATPase DnaA
MDELKTIVNNIFLTDVDSENRQRQVVDARKVYSKILRDLGYSCQAVGDSIKKDHATIIHYQKSIEHLLAYDDTLREKYKACKNAFYLTKNI